MLPLPSRYEHRRLLGQGGMGQVHLVFDRERDEDVALKTFAPAEGADLEEGRFLFKQEFWAMASLRHPNLVAAHDYGELGDGTPYMTMELVPGHDLFEDGSAQIEAEVRTWLPGIASALAYLHGRGFVHGDLKPENIRLREDGVPKLMDLGLLTRSGRAGGPIRGSLLYMAPEAIKQAAVDGRADLYGLGAVLYHVLAGRAPFEGDSPMVLLRAHLDDTPEALRKHAPDLTRELDAAVMKLLSKEPAARFASAGELLEALGLQAEGAMAVGLLGAPVIGRGAVQAELSALSTTFAPVVLWLAGAAGVGKSRLLAETRAEAQLNGETVLVAEGLGTDAAPYQALKPWLKALAGPPSEVRDRLAPVLVKLLPELNVTPAAALEGAPERVRLHAAVVELATSRVETGLWLLDGADRLDPASAELLNFLQRQGAERPWRFVLTGESAPEGVETLHLEPLSELDTLALAEALLGQEDLPEVLVERLSVLTGGVPGTVEAVLGHWLRTGALKREGGRWTAGPAEAFELPGGLQLVLDARFQELSADAQHVGRVAALIGANGDLRALSALAERPESTFFQALSELEGAEVLSREENQYRFGRPAQATALAASWEADEARKLHSSAARHLAARTGGDPADPALPMDLVLAVAGHHLAGETPEHGVPWAISGARRALAIFAVAQAESLLTRALALEGLSASDRMGLQTLQVQVLRFKAQIDQALALYEADLMPALREANAPELGTNLVTFGVLHQLKGRYPEALAAFAEAINLADSAGDAATGVRARLFAGRVGLFSGKNEVAITHLASAVRRAREAHLPSLLARSLSFYGYLIASKDAARLAEGLGYLDEAIAINRELNDFTEMHEALNNQGNVYMTVGRLLDAKAVFEECLAITTRIGSANEAIFAHLNSGGVSLELGDLAAAQSHGRKGAELSRAQGRKFPEGYALGVEGLALVYRGELGTGAERLQVGLALSREIANKYLELNILAYWANALVQLGRFKEAGEAIAQAREIAAATSSDEHNAKFDRFESAIAVVQGAPDAAAKVEALVASARTAAQPVALAHALRWQAERHVRQGDSDAAMPALNEAAGLAAANGLTMLQAELAYLRARALQSGDTADAAAVHFGRAFDQARAIGYRILEILCQSGIGASDAAQREHRLEAPRRMEALLAGLDEAEREAYLAWPERAEVLNTPAPAGLEVSADRLHHLTDLMAAITTQQDLGAVMQQALAAFVDIAGAERGFLLLYDGFEVAHQIFHGMSEEEGDAYSSTLAYQVLWSGEPVFVEDAQADAELGNKASIQALSLRSVLGMPLHDGHDVIGVMIADSQRINTRFSAADMDLALTLARQVAIAISNARRLERYKNGYEELEKLHGLALELLGVTTLEALMAPVSALAVELTGADRVFFLLGEELTIRAGVDAALRPLSLDTRDISSSISRWVYEKGEPLHLMDAASDDTFQVQKSVMALGLRTVFAVPIAHGGNRLGVLYLDNQRMVDANPVALRTLARVGEMVGAFVARQGL
jgi:serine/threonine-protein kinase